MPIISTKRLATIVRATFSEALAEFRTDVLLQVECAAKTKIDSVQYKKMEDHVLVMQDQLAQLRDANSTLRRQVIALQQILHGKAQEEVRQALVKVTENLRDNVNITEQENE